jgi:hypothetical protein
MNKISIVKKFQLADMSLWVSLRKWEVKNYYILFVKVVWKTTTGLKLLNFELFCWPHFKVFFVWYCFVATYISSKVKYWHFRTENIFKYAKPTSLRHVYIANLLTNLSFRWDIDRNFLCGLPLMAIYNIFVVFLPTSGLVFDEPLNITHV